MTDIRRFIKPILLYYKLVKKKCSIESSPLDGGDR